jgi:hypothetical protein
MPFDYDSDEQLSARLSLTPEGFMIARDAVFARTGTQDYHSTEIPTVDADDDGWVSVDRDEAEVFHPRSLASFVGKPVVMLHPEDMVGPHNVGTLQVGHVMNARRGEGEFADCVVGDLFITDQRAIEGIRSGAWRSLSAGYDARYVQQGRGRASQHDITINHVALLPTGQARCGPRCMIQDSKPRKGKTMRRTRDQTVMGEHRAWANDPFLKNRSSGMGSDDPKNDVLSVGPSIVARIPYPPSHLTIGTDGNGNAVVWYHGSPDDTLDMGQIAQGTGPLPRPSNRNVDAQRRAMVAADTAWSKRTLQGINAANAAFWKQSSGKA